MVEVRGAPKSPPLLVSRTKRVAHTALGRGSHRWSLNQVAARHNMCPTFVWSVDGEVIRRSVDVIDGEW